MAYFYDFSNYEEMYEFDAVIDGEDYRCIAESSYNTTDFLNYYGIDVAVEAADSIFNQEAECLDISPFVRYKDGREIVDEDIDIYEFHWTHPDIDVLYLKCGVFGKELRTVVHLDN